MEIIAFVPIRLNSKRVNNKNLKLLGDKPLLTYIFNELLKVDSISKIYAFCSSETIIKYLPEGVHFLKREQSLDSDNTLGEDIYSSFIAKVKADLYILSHTTSPFIKATTIQNSINQILTNKYDSALSVEKFQTFAWYKNQPLNYSLNDIPRTQNISPVYIETSAFYMFKRETWLKDNRRIGEKPYFQIIDKIEGIDIDYPEDFEFAEKILNNM